MSLSSAICFVARPRCISPHHSMFPDLFYHVLKLCVTTYMYIKHPIVYSNSACTCLALRTKSQLILSTNL